MVKRAALSIRISEQTKAAIDEAAARDRRSTASLVEKILEDWMAGATGRPRKFPSPDQQIAAGGQLLDLLLPTGRRLRDANSEDLVAVGEAYRKAAERMERKEARERAVQKPKRATNRVRRIRGRHALHRRVDD